MNIKETTIKPLRFFNLELDENELGRLKTFVEMASLKGGLDTIEKADNKLILRHISVALGRLS